MSDGVRCPICIDGEVVLQEGRLDQSGQTYLPTSVTLCTTCGWARYEPARTAAWQPTRAPAALADEAPRRAA
jgi:hypothetical protein